MSATPRVEIVELSARLGLLPGPARLTPAAASAIGRLDLLVCVLGFEARCLSIPRLLADAGVHAGCARYLTYVTNTGDNRANEPQLAESLAEITDDDDVEPLLGDDPQFAEHFAALLARLPRDTKGPPRVALDISVASNRLVMRCLKALLGTDVRLVVLYAEAATYHPTRAEWDADRREWTLDERLGLERGVGDLDFSVEYPGHNLEPLPEFLLIFPAFSNERSQAVLGAVDPSLATPQGHERVLWFLGVPHLAEDRWRLDALREINGLGDDDQQRTVSTFDFTETLRDLDTAYRAVDGTHRVTLSPMGSKLQALGAALFATCTPMCEWCSPVRASTTQRATHTAARRCGCWTSERPQVCATPSMQSAPCG